VAVVSMVALMAILVILVAANVKALWQLKQELRLVEQKQIRRLQPEPTPTNVVTRAGAESAPAPARSNTR
jgi:hypothetical protein